MKRRRHLNKRNTRSKTLGQVLGSFCDRAAQEKKNKSELNLSSDVEGVCSISDAANKVLESARVAATDNKVLDTARGERTVTKSSAPRPGPGPLPSCDNQGALERTDGPTDAAPMSHMHEIGAKSLTAQRDALPDDYETTLASLNGVFFRGTERLATATILSALHIGPDALLRRKLGKRLVSIMRRLGWNGPKTMFIPGRINDRGNSAAYWRLPLHKPEPTALADFEADGLPEPELSEHLEQVTRQGLRKLSRVLRLPTDIKDGNLLRSQVTAAGIAINAQLRADEQRLRAKVSGDVLGRLLAAIERERKRQEAEQSDAGESASA